MCGTDPVFRILAERADIAAGKAVCLLPMTIHGSVDVPALDTLISAGNVMVR